MNKKADEILNVAHRFGTCNQNFHYFEYFKTIEIVKKLLSKIEKLERIEKARKKKELKIINKQTCNHSMKYDMKTGGSTCTICGHMS